MRLLALARPRALKTPQQASGHCLRTALEFVRLAHQKGHSGLQLVRWRLRGDPNHLDHWAVWVDTDLVIDLTAVQVDGRSRLAGPARDYPDNYTNRRCYPAALLLEGLNWAADGSLRPLSHSMLIGMAARLFKHDCKSALQQRSPAWAVESLRTFCSFNVWLALRGATRRLRTRAAALNRSLAVHPHYVAEAAHHQHAQQQTQLHAAQKLPHQAKR